MTAVEIDDHEGVEEMAVQERPGVAAAAAAYVVAWLDGARPDTPDVRALYELVRRRLDDDDATGLTYVRQSPGSARARRTLARDVEQLAQEDERFADGLRGALDGLRATGGPEWLLAHGGAGVVQQVVDGDRRGATAFLPGLVAALGESAPEAVLGAAARAEAARAEAARPGPTALHTVFLVFFGLSVACVLTLFVGGVMQSRSVLYAGLVAFVPVTAVAAVLYRMPKQRGVAPDA